VNHRVLWGMQNWAAACRSEALTNVIEKWVKEPNKSYPNHVWLRYINMPAVKQTLDEFIARYLLKDLFIDKLYIY